MTQPEKNNWLKYSGVGTQIAIFILVFWWIGNKLEIRYDFKPWGSLAGLLLGATIGLYELWKIIDNNK